MPWNEQVLALVPLEKDLLVLQSGPYDDFSTWAEIDIIVDAGVNISPLREIRDDIMTGIEPLHDVSD